MSNYYFVEMTDTYAGEANYCWVRRYYVKAQSMLAAVRQAKAACGYTGHKCRRDSYGDRVDLFPSGCNVVIFVSWHGDTLPADGALAN